MNFEHELGRYKKKVLDMEKERERLREDIEGMRELQQCFEGIIYALAEKVFKSGTCEISFEDVQKNVKKPEYIIEVNNKEKKYEFRKNNF